MKRLMLQIRKTNIRRICWSRK